MAEGSKLFQTRLEIVGAVSPALIASLKQTVGHLGRVKIMSQDVGKESKKGFEAMKEGVEGAKKATEGLKEVMKELLLPILSVVGAFSSIKGAFGVLDEAAEKYKGMKESISQFKSVLAASGVVTSGVISAEDLLKLYDTQAEAAGLRDGSMFGKGILRGVQEKLASGASLGPGVTAGLTSAIPLAVARMGTGVMDVTKEKTDAMAEAIAQSIQTGRANREILAFDKAHIKAFREANTEGRIQMILQSRYFRNQDAYLKEQERDNPNEVKLLRLRIENEKQRIELGSKYLEVNEKVEQIGLRTQGLLLDVMTNALELIGPERIEGLFSGIEEAIKRTKSYLKWLFDPKDGKNFGDKVKESMLNAFEAIKANWKTVLDNMIAGLDKMIDPNAKPGEGIASKAEGGLISVLTATKDALVGLHNLLGGRVDNDLVLLATAFAGFKALDIAGEIRSWLVKLGLINIQAAVVNVNGPVAGGVAGAVGQGGLVSAAVAVATAALPAVIAATAAAGAVNILLRTTNKDVALNTRADLAEKVAEENEKYIQAMKDLAIKYDSGNIDPEGYRKALQDLEAAHRKQLEDLDRLQKANDLLISSNVKLSDSAQAAANALQLMTAKMGAFPISGVDTTGGAGGGPSGGYSGGTGGIRVEGYGPAYGEGGQVIGSHDNRLTLGDYAVSANLAAGHSVGSMFDFVDGRGVKHTGRYEDASMKAPGVPNFNVIEGWNQPDLGRISNIHWLANGGLVSKKVLSFLGDNSSGREAVVPLDRGGMAKAGLASKFTAGAFAPVLNVYGAGDNMVQEIESVLEDKFQQYIDLSFHEWERRNLS